MTDIDSDVRPPHSDPELEAILEADRAFRRKQRRSMDLFKFLRWGRFREWKLHRDQRSQVYHTYEVPKPGPWPGIASRFPADDLPRGPQPPYHNLVDLPGHTFGLGNDTRAQDAHRRLIKGLSRYLYRHNLGFNKVLGAGGFGVVALFDVKEEGQYHRQVAIKVAIGNYDEEEIEQEKGWHKV